MVSDRDFWDGASRYLGVMPPSLDPWMTDAVAAALRTEGCPAATAERLAAQARIAEHDGWMLVLLGHGHGIEVPVERETWEWAASAVAMNVAADNAEAVDRASRGEPGWTPLWPLPDRRSRS